MKKWILLIIAILIPVTGLVAYRVSSNPYYHGVHSDHFNGHEFYNPDVSSGKKFTHLLKWMWIRHPIKWPDSIPVKQYAKPPARVAGSELLVTFIGHDSILIQTEGLNILTDPIFTQRASPVNWIGPKRVTPPGIHLQDLPKIDIILISHNHYDHLSLPSIKSIEKRDHPLIFSGLGVDKNIHSINPSIPVDALDWGQCRRLQKLKFCFVDVQHWSGRGIFDRFKTLWGGYVIETTDGNIFFSGDTGYDTGKIFTNIEKQYGPFRFAMLPLGAYEPHWFMKFSHMDPAESVKAFGLLHAQNAMGMHLHTFQLSDEAYDAPDKALAKALKEDKIKPEHFRILQAGQSWQVPV